MIATYLSVLFLLKLRHYRSNNVTNYLRRKYDGSTLRNYRRLESSMKKLRKAQLDLDFLLYCKTGSIIPNFIKFKLYRVSLYSTEFYKSTTQSLLDIEIDFKNKSIKRLTSIVADQSAIFYNVLSLLDSLYMKTLLNRNIQKYVNDTSATHRRKLLKLGLQKPRLIAPNNVIFNFSSYKLSKKEKFLLAFCLDFCLPNFKPNFAKFFLPFETFFDSLRKQPFHSHLEQARILHE